MNHTLLQARATARVLGLIVLFSLPACNGDSGGDDSTCQPGTERCPCDRGACNAGLTCLSNVCVQGTAGSGGTAGNPSGGSGGTNSGGTNSGGTSGSGTGGQVLTGGSSGLGGNITGGTGGTGADTGGSSGTGGDGGTGGGSCGDTQSDPMNCGQCGRVCRSDVGNIPCPDVGCCAQGNCGPFLGECINRATGITTCAQYCESIGETCAARSCAGSNITFGGYSGLTICNSPSGTPLSHGTNECDAPIDFDEDPAIRCCCTDTQP